MLGIVGPVFGCVCKHGRRLAYCTLTRILACMCVAGLGYQQTRDRSGYILHGDSRWQFEVGGITDGRVTRAEFKNYYKIHVSRYFPDDAMFVETVKRSWKMDDQTSETHEGKDSKDHFVHGMNLSDHAPSGNAFDSVYGTAHEGKDNASSFQGPDGLKLA